MVYQLALQIFCLLFLAEIACYLYFCNDSLPFQDVVSIFASVPDPDYPGHVILEQFQAQVRY